MKNLYLKLKTTAKKQITKQWIVFENSEIQRKHFTNNCALSLQKKTFI